MIRKKIVAVIIIITALVSFGLGWFLNNHNKSLANDDKPKNKQITYTDSIENITDSIMNIKYPIYEVYGMPNEKDKQRQIVDYTYKFRFHIIGGCEVDDMTKVRTEINNEKTNKIMISRYGKHWMGKFERSVDSLYSLDSLAIDIAQKDKHVRRIESQIEQYHSHIQPKYKCWETSESNKRMVTLDAESPSNGQMKYMNQFRATVDIKNKKVTNLDSTPFEY